MRIAARTLILLFFLLCVAVVPSCRAKRSTSFLSRPSILLITVDALRFDHLGCYGYHLNTSPHIDRLAKNGVIFQTALSPSTLTASVLPSLFTSTSPSRHGCFEWSPGREKIDPSLKNLAQVLNEHSYKTAFFSNHGALGSIGGFQTGWDVWSDNDSNAHDLTTSAIEWVDSQKEGPVFLWLHYIEPHFPYTPPIEFATMFVDQTITREEILEWRKDHAWRMGDDDNSAFEYLHGLDPKWLQFVISQYDGEIFYTDQEIGRLTRFFSAGSPFLIAISADHGEAFGDREGLFFHGGPPFDPVMRVPLVLYGPTIIPGDMVLEQHASLLDIMPTFLDAAGIGAPEQCEGINLLKILESPWKEERRVLMSETLNDDLYWLALRDRDSKLLSTYHGTTLVSRECFDLVRDPLEIHSCYDENDPHVRTLLRMEKEHMDSLFESIHNQQLQVGRSVDQESELRLKELGYVN